MRHCRNPPLSGSVPHKTQFKQMADHFSRLCGETRNSTFADEMARQRYHNKEMLSTNRKIKASARGMGEVGVACRPACALDEEYKALELIFQHAIASKRQRPSLSWPGETKNQVSHSGMTAVVVREAQERTHACRVGSCRWGGFSHQFYDF